MNAHQDFSEKKEPQVFVNEVTYIDSDLESFNQNSCTSPSGTVNTNVSDQEQDDTEDKHNPYWLMMTKDANTAVEQDIDSSFDILELLHTIILILSIVILIMIFNLFFSESQPQGKGSSDEAVKCLIGDYIQLSDAEKLVVMEYLSGVGVA